MLSRIFLPLMFALILMPTAWSLTTPTGIRLDQPWKVKLNEFAVKAVSHQSWGYPHSERNYHNTLKLANLEGLPIDLDVLLAAALLHDLGGTPAYEKKGVDHAVRSAEVVGPLLTQWGFPRQKLEEVKEVILGHVYYGPMPASPFARLFRDADILDFLGPMGVARIFGATTEMGKEPALGNSLAVLKDMMANLPKELSCDSAKSEGQKRVREMDAILKKMAAYTFGGKAF